MKKLQASVICVLSYGTLAHRPNTTVDNKHGACMIVEMAACVLKSAMTYDVAVHPSPWFLDMHLCQDMPPGRAACTELCGIRLMGLV